MRVSFAIAAVACLVGVVVVALVRPEREPSSDAIEAFERGGDAPVGDGPRESKATLAAQPFVPLAPDQEVKVAFGSETTSSIARKGTRVRVLDGDGVPVPFGIVSIAVGEGEAYLTTFRGGAARVPPMSADAWIEVYACEDRDGAALPWAAVSSGPIVPGTKDVEIRLPPDEPIAGVVRDGGRGVAAVRIDATPEDRPAALTGARGQHSAAVTDDEGRFALRGLHRGTYRLVALPPAPYLLPAPTTASAGSKGVAITLHAGLDVAPRVVDSRDEPVGSAEIRLRLSTSKQQGFEVAAESTDETGTARFSRLDASRPLALRVEPPSWRKDVLPFDVDPWIPGDAKIRLPRGFVVRGRVVDLEGNPIPQPWVTLMGVETSETGDGDGTFEFGRLRAGRVTVRAVLDGHPTDDHPAYADADAGAGDVKIVLDAGHDLTVRIEDWVEHRRHWRHVGLWRTRADGSEDGFTSSVDEEGFARFRGLRDGARYTLFVPPVARDATSFVDRDVTAATGTRVVRLEPGRSIRGRVLLDGPPEAIDVRARVGQEIVRGAVAEDGSYEILGMPEGRYRVGAADLRVPLPSRVWRTAFADVGGTAPDIDLRPR